MELFTTDSGRTERGMEEENKSGKMEHFIKATGKTIWPMVRVV